MRPGDGVCIPEFLKDYRRFINPSKSAIRVYKRQARVQSRQAAKRKIASAIADPDRA